MSGKEKHRWIPRDAAFWANQFGMRLCAGCPKDMRRFGINFSILRYSGHTAAMIPNIARISELECLRAYIQAQHVEHVKTEIDIALMMLGLSRFKRQLREADESARVLSYAREAIAEARRSVTLINCAESRAPLEPRIAELESIVEEFYCRA